MTAKEYLRQYEDAQRRAERLKIEYERQQELIDTIKSTSDIDGMPKSKNRPNIEDKILKLAEKAERYRQAEAEALEIRQEVFETVNKVPGNEGDVLMERYIHLKKWEEICVHMNYSWRGIHKLHQKALHLVDEIISA